MNKSIRILITVICLIFLVISIDCIAGFTLGGRVGLVHIIIFVVTGLITSELSIVFINGKEYLKSKGYTEALILISIGMVITCFLMYGALNYISAENESITYDTRVEYTSQNSRILGIEIGFENQDGVLCNTVDYNGIWIEDNAPEEDGNITICERQGGFGYPIYSIVAVNGKPER